MRPESYQTFVELLESFIAEDSTAMNVLAANPGGSDVVKHIHKNLQLAHNLNYTPVPDIAWSAIKGSSNGHWILIKGSTGTAAIKSRGDTYDVVASSGGEVKTMTDTHGGRIKAFIKTEIGKLDKFYQARNTRDVATKRDQRASNKKGSDGSAIINRDTLVQKFKPLWVRAMSAAIADIKGHIANMIKNDAFGKAMKKLKYVESLQSDLEELESGSISTPEYVNRAVQTAIYMAASHHYPEQTGNISRDYGDRYSTQFPEGPQILLKAIAGGDTAKLGTVLGFFKRALISG